MLKRLQGVALAAALLMSGSGIAMSQALNDNLLSDPRVRQAIAYAVDMDTIGETLFEGRVIVADSLLPNGPLKPAGLNPYSYDPDKARELLAAAGWDSSRELDVVFYYGDQLTVDFMAAVQAYLADVGIKISYRKIQGDVNAALSAPPTDPVDGQAGIDWDLAYGATAALALQEFYNVYKTGISANTPGNAERDALIAGINASSDPDELKPAYAAIQQYFSESMDSIPLYYQQLFIYESNKLNRNGNGYGNAQFNYDWGITEWTIEPDANGKMIMNTNTAPAQFFEMPWKNLGIWITSKVVFDRLLVTDGGMSSFEGSMAESFDVSADGMTVNVTLKDGLTWHDGAALTIDDVVWSLQTAMKAGTINSVVSNTVMSIEGASAYQDGSADSASGLSTDGNTITLQFETLDPNVLLTLSQFAILPKHLLDGVDPLQLQQHAYWQNPVGSGSFKIEEVQMNDFVRYVPFEGYHGGVAKLDEIVAFPSGDGDANLIKNATAGKMDYGFTKNVPDVAALEALGTMRVIAADIPYTRGFWVNKFALK
ncbi:MAG: peptide ABC transporter substrate-binding protein [Marinosulfonomonas sp.]|nr:MAG: peptide ABC transporter substrate-binding protein [Marinosulfonomonas sp.]